VFSSLRSNLMPSLVIGQSSPFNLRSPGSIIADNARVSPWTNRVADRSERERKETSRLLEDVIARSRTWPDILAIPIRDVIRGAGCWLHERGKDHLGVSMTLRGTFGSSLREIRSNQRSRTRRSRETCTGCELLIGNAWNLRITFGERRANAVHLLDDGFDTSPDKGVASPSRRR